MITQPNILDRYLHISQLGFTGVNRRYIGRWGMQAKVIVLHIQEGSNIGSWQHFHSVTASSTVLIGKNGDIWRLVPEEDGPWTNGDVQGSSALGWEVINQFGPDPNVYALTIETEGYWYEWPKTGALMNSVVWQIVTWMRKYNIPVRYVLRHADINGITRPNCPGQPFYDEVMRLVKLEMAEPVEPMAPVYAAVRPIYLNGKDGATWNGEQDIVINGAKFYADKRLVGVRQTTPVKQYAFRNSGNLRTPLGKDKSFNALGWVEGGIFDGDKRWWITKHFGRIPVALTGDKPILDKGDNMPEVTTDGVVVHGGRVYYPAKDGEADRVITITASKANLREDATTDSSILGVVTQGQTYRVAYWTFGDEVRDEYVWWVLRDPDGRDPLVHGGRLWIEATTTRV